MDTLRAMGLPRASYRWLRGAAKGVRMDIQAPPSARPTRRSKTPAIIMLHLASIAGTGGNTGHGLSRVLWRIPP